MLQGPNGRFPPAIQLGLELPQTKMARHRDHLLEQNQRDIPTAIVWVGQQRQMANVAHPAPLGHVHVDPSDDLALVEQQQVEVPLKIDVLAPFLEQRLVGDGALDEQSFRFRNSTEKPMQCSAVSSPQGSHHDFGAISQATLQWEPF